MSSAGWKYSHDHGQWTFIEADDTVEPLPLERSLRLATLNCLHDNSQPELLQHGIRHEAILRELASLDADVIGLNEVTKTLLERILQAPWVRRSYTVSAVPEDARCEGLGCVTAGAFGNLLLSKIAPVSVVYVEQLGDGRHGHAMSFCLSDPQGGDQPLHVTVCAAHLTAAPWVMEGRRRKQLEHVTSALTTGLSRGASVDSCVIMGDYNFHREAENASIPSGWAEVPAVVSLGPTWSLERNAMLPHYLPLCNLYNGFGLSASLGWPSPMRLDRVLVHGHALESAGAKARLFADQPIDDRARGRAALPRTGRELREAHRALPWQEYLHPSDHFGILLELPLAATKAPRSPSARQQEHAS